jgi:hypothetical protein
MSHRNRVLVSLLVGAVLFGLFAPAWGAAVGVHSLPSGSSAPATTRSSAPLAPSITSSPSLAPATTSVRSLSPSAAIWSQAAFPLGLQASPSPAVSPSVGSNPVTYAQASANLTAAAAGTDSMNWAVAAVIGEDVASPTSFPLGPVTSNCSVTWIATPVSSIYIPATPASAPAGTSNAYLSVLANATSSTEVLLADVINGSANLIAKVAPTAGCNLSGLTSPLPPNIIDSPQVIAIANASGGASFLAQFPNAMREWQTSSNSGSAATWFVTYQSPCGAVFEAAIVAVSGFPYGFFESTACTYNVTFTETGLSAGTAWTVAVNNSTYTSTNSSIGVRVANGSYPFVVSANGYGATPASGTAVVAGATLNQSVTFALNSSNYTVSFLETGLASGATWRVALIGHGFYFVSTNGSTVSFAVPNGTYSFSIAAGGYAANTSSGIVLVAGVNQTVDIGFTAVLAYPVLFTETGLPTSGTWQVELNGTLGPYLYTFSGNATATIYVGNGTYFYSVTSDTNGFSPAPPNGTVTVAGAQANVSVTFVQNTSFFPVWFNETGLAAGAFWGVLVNSTGFASSNGSSLLVYLPNGSYAFSLLPIYGYTGAPASGTFTVSGAAGSVTVTFSTATMYLVTFNETGLPAGAGWYVTVGNLTTVLVTPQFAFYSANATLTFEAGTFLTYWRAAPMAGTLTVNGAAAVQTIVFSPVPTYQVSFPTSGLLLNATWSLDFNGTTVTTNNSSLTYFVVNGTYNYSVEPPTNFTANPVSGTLVVNGSAVSVLVVFSPIPAGSSVVTVQETGLPPSTPWTATFTNTTSNVSAAFNTNGTEFETSLPAGLYNVTANTSVGGWWTANVVLSATVVLGVNASVNVTFLAFGQTVYFNETGLPAGTVWWANVTGATPLSTTGTNVSLFLVNGSYTYTLGSADKHYAGAAGSFTLPIVGNATINVTFAPVEFAVTLTESGLPAGTTWWANVTSGPSVSSTSTQLVVSLVNGTYAYTVASGNKSWTASGGSLTVAGAALPVAVSFTLVTFTVTFTETGLPAGTTWWANVSGGTSVTSTGTSASGALPNGSYTYTIATTDKSYAAVGGSLTVTGAAAGATVTFVLVTYSVTFTETGLPAGTNWSVTLGATTHYSTTTTITVAEPNGTYAYTVGSVSGYGPNASSGSVHVAGGPANRALTFSAASPASPFLGLPNNEGYYLLGAIIVVVIGAGIGVGLKMRHRGSKGGSDPSEFVGEGDSSGSTSPASKKP